MTGKRQPPTKPRVLIAALTPLALTTLQTHVQSLSRCKPRQSETILKLARAQLAITKALEPMEQARADLLATVPPVPSPTSDEATVKAYALAKDECDEKFREIYLKQKFKVDLPPPLSTADLQYFADPISPNDLAALHPYVVKLD